MLAAFSESAARSVSIAERVSIFASSNSRFSSYINKYMFMIMCGDHVYIADEQGQKRKKTRQHTIRSTSIRRDFVCESHDDTQILSLSHTHGRVVLLP